MAGSLLREEGITGLSVSKCAIKIKLFLILISYLLISCNRTQHSNIKEANN